MVDWCAVYQGNLDLGDYTLNRPAFQVVRVSLEPDLARVNYTTVTAIMNIFASRRMFNSSGAPVISRYVKLILPNADMPNNALKAAWLAIASEFTLDQASFDYFPYPVVGTPAVLA